MTFELRKDNSQPYEVGLITKYVELAQIQIDNNCECMADKK